MVAGLVLLSAMLLLLMPLGYLGIVFVIGSGVLALVVGFHYLVWGKWMKRVLEDDIARQHDDV
jgi:O-antigen/teichoic acid export membrane protein